MSRSVSASFRPTPSKGYCIVLGGVVYVSQRVWYLSWRVRCVWSKGAALHAPLAWGLRGGGGVFGQKGGGAFTPPWRRAWKGSSRVHRLQHGHRLARGSGGGEKKGARRPRHGRVVRAGACAGDVIVSGGRRGGGRMKRRVPRGVGPHLRAGGRSVSAPSCVVGKRLGDRECLPSKARNGEAAKATIGAAGCCRAGRRLPGNGAQTKPSGWWAMKM